MLTLQSCNLSGWGLQMDNGKWNVLGDGFTFKILNHSYLFVTGDLLIMLLLILLNFPWKLFWVLNGVCFSSQISITGTDWLGLFSWKIVFPFYKFVVMGVFENHSKFTSMFLTFRITLNSWSPNLGKWLWLWFMKKHKLLYFRFDTTLLSAFFRVCGP